MHILGGPINLEKVKAAHLKHTFNIRKNLKV